MNEQKKRQSQDERTHEKKTISIRRTNKKREKCTLTANEHKTKTASVMRTKTHEHYKTNEKKRPAQDEQTKTIIPKYERKQRTISARRMKT